MGTIKEYGVYRSCLVRWHWIALVHNRQDSKMTFWTAVICVQIYVFLKSWNDSVYILQKQTIPTHGIEWLQVATVSTIAAIGYTRNLWGIAAFDGLQLAITWILMDIELNAFLNHNWFTYIGSGWWDEFFKFHYRKNTVLTMWLFKAGLLIFATGLFSYYLFRLA